MLWPIQGRDRDQIEGGTEQTVIAEDTDGHIHRTRARKPKMEAQISRGAATITWAATPPQAITASSNLVHGRRKRIKPCIGYSSSFSSFSLLPHLSVAQFVGPRGNPILSLLLFLQPKIQWICCLGDDPVGLQSGGLEQGLHDYAILFGLFA
jgi:hypothetical protein